jgi:tetratricopeptide (TPR) repeat protein
MMPQTNSVFGPVETDIQNKKFSAAMKKLIGISNQFSKDIRFLSLLGITQKALADTNGLLKTLEVIAAQTGTQVAQLDYMAALYAAGRLNEALDVGLELQETARTETMTEVNERYLTRLLTKIYLEFSDHEGIQETIETFHTRYGLDDAMLWSLGLVALAAGRQTEAITYFRSAVAMNPANDKAWVSLAMLHEDMGDRELAVANLEKALDANPQNATGLKLMSKWGVRSMEQAQKIMTKLDYYLSKHEFDEEVSLCYVQLLKDHQSIHMAEFEMDKLNLIRTGRDLVIT